MTDPPKKTRKNGKRGSTMGETIFKEEGKLVRPGRGLTPPANPRLRPPDRWKGQESEEEREEVRTRIEKKDGVNRGS